MPRPTLGASGEFPLTSPPPGVVIDTNVVLDWLLFHNPAVAPLAAAVLGGRLRWWATPPMREELADVLRRGLASRWSADADSLLRVWDAHATHAAPAPRHRLQCSDPDDQKFVDLAFSAAARWLVSRDRALLKLRRPAAALGLQVLTPERWSLDP